MSRSRARRRLVAAIALAASLTVVGLLGTYSYWESYYQHRGFRAVALLPHALPGRRLTVRFYSPALRRQADYYVYLPPRYDPALRRYPVYYLLHGSPGRPQVYFGVASLRIRLDNLLSRHRARPMIMVFPDGRIGGSTYSDSEWANTRSGAYESYVLDVVRDVDRRFATIPNRGSRVIGGFSAGGYGATNIVLHHPEVFGSLQSWSGYYRQTRTGVFARASAATLADNSPLDYVRRLGSQLLRYPVRAFLFTGRDDNSSPELAPMANALAAKGASVKYALYRGGHDWQLWHAHLDQMLILASRDVSRPLRAGNGVAGTLTPGVVPIPHGRGRRHHRHRRHHARHRHRHRRVSHGGPLELRRHRPAAPPRARAGGLGPGTFPHRLQREPAERLGAGGRPHGRLGLGELLAGLMLALGSAALINLGFLLQHRGLGRQSPQPLPAALRGALGNRTWLAGQALGWIGFATQIVAVAIAPLSLVQAFAAGGLALSVPLAARFFAHRITRAQLLAVVLIAAGLAALPFGFSTAADHLHSSAPTIAVGVAVGLGLVTSTMRAAAVRAIAAGIFYGVADAAIKAVAVTWHGQGSLAPGWTALAALATFAGFLAFQSALQSRSAIAAISLMNAFATLVALGCGLIAFGESLGAGPAAVAVHVIAITVVLGCVPVLAAAQASLAQPAEHVDRGEASPPPRVPA